MRKSDRNSRVEEERGERQQAQIIPENAREVKKDTDPQIPWINPPKQITVNLQTKHF